MLGGTWYRDTATPEDEQDATFGPKVWGVGLNEVESEQTQCLLAILRQSTYGRLVAGSHSQQDFPYHRPHRTGSRFRRDLSRPAVRPRHTACARNRRAGERGESARMKDALDFAAINQAALAAFPAVMNRLLPRGKAVGREIVALNPRRADRNLGSFKVNRFNGRWCDFATGDRGGDPISLVAYLADVSQGEAARLLAQMLGLETGGRRHG
jgi:hypothetical protein